MRAPAELAAALAPRSGRRRVLVALLLVAAAIALVAAPALINPYWMRVLSTVFMYAVIAQGLNLMAGYTGYPAFGNVVFFGLGGYTTAVLMVKAGASFGWAALAATALCPLLVLAVGPPLLKLKGHYFAIATLGLNEAAKELVTNATALTGGGMGLSLPLPPGSAADNATRFYYLFLAVMFIATWITWEVSRRSLGLACRAIRDNETKAESAGMRTTRYKTVVWMISAAMTGAVGAINASWLTYINAPSLFDMNIAVKAFVIYLLGGSATVLGPIAGAFVIELAGTYTWSRFLDWHLGVMGVIIMLVILLLPDGLRTVFRSR